MLRRLVRDAEDKLYANEINRDGAHVLWGIRATVSAGLAEVERHESEELTTRIRAQAVQGERRQIKD
jgi:hypothetical protein